MQGDEPPEIEDEFRPDGHGESPTSQFVQVPYRVVGPYVHTEKFFYESHCEYHGVDVVSSCPDRRGGAAFSKKSLDGVGVVNVLSLGAQVGDVAYLVARIGE